MGQELCYLCHQRALRNIPIDITQERREKEQTEDKLLQEYQHQRDLLALAREQVTRNTNCQYNREIASFNVDAAKKKVYFTLRFSSTAGPCAIIDSLSLLIPQIPRKSSEFCVS